MSCDCNTPASPQTVQALGGAPATIPEQIGVTGDCETVTPYAEVPCNSGSALQSSTSQGAVVGASLTDARCVADGEGVTLLARAGTRMARFVGTGFLHIIAGQAKLVSWIPIQIRNLWHTWVQPSATSQPILSNPRPFPYGVIGDANGNLYGIQGYQDADTLHVWSYVDQEWQSKKVCELAIETCTNLPQSTHLELTGFEEVPLTGDTTDVRTLKALCGQGVIYLERVPVAQPPADEDGCEPCPEENFAYVAKVLEFPDITQSAGTETGRHRLVFSSQGLYWEAEDDPGEVVVGSGLLGND